MEELERDAPCKSTANPVQAVPTPECGLPAFAAFVGLGLLGASFGPVGSILETRGTAWGLGLRLVEFRALGRSLTRGRV